MTSRHSPRNQRLRLEIAAEAARIMATEGQRSYKTAKLKAARRLGASIRNGLPSNEEVELALKEWQGLYGGPRHEEVLLELRRAALSAMRFFQRFRPRLVGPVLEGTADEHSRISLHAFADHPDAIIHFLMEHNLPFSQEVRRIRWHDGETQDLEVVVVEAAGTVVELLLMIGPQARQAPPSPVTGRPQRRASLSEVELLISDALAENSPRIHDDAAQ